MPRKRDSEAYESDGGFIEDAPKSKKSRKAAANETKRREGKQEVNLSKQTDEEGNPYFELSKMRRITVSKYGGKDLVNIREYYEKDGKTLPGKKGISLTIDQFTALISVLPDLEAILSARGSSLPRPKYERDKEDSAASKVDEEEEEDDDEDDDDEPVSRKNKKPNFDETSDEEEIDA
ncbi:PC4-domain-containing protein [Rhizodiscina lignyota]|uniref:PC4-domain-containing protein n=1 Tax=Rhizodiscina lignyota TaxID=1504668 RepID=A0A9P4M986_9PEZI|nr:PC4-domain-containing protein [Rhizodiscina lignyota]